MRKIETALPPGRRPEAVEAREILESDSGLILQQIGRPGTAAVVWRRTRSADFAGWVETIPAGQLPMLRALVDFRAVERCVHAACDLSGLPAGTMRDLLASDVAALALMFARVMGNPLLHLRLEAVTTDACRRFHIDRVPARLLCTYRGPGTCFGLEDADGGIVPAAEMRGGEVAILRGALWPGDEVTRLLHRSPPIAGGGAGSGDARLLLVMDPAVEPAAKSATGARRLH